MSLYTRTTDPPPPPLYGLSLKEHNRRTLDSRPQVNGQPCTAGGPCENHPDNQFLLLHWSDGTYLACVAPEVPLSTDPLRPGSRCGICKITDGVVLCNKEAVNQ